MSIEVRVLKEITEYQEKIIFGLSFRQLICFAIALVSGVATYFLGSKLLGRNITGYLVIAEVMPIFAVGFKKLNGFAFEKYAAMMFSHKFGTSRRKYKTSLLIDEIGIKIEKALKKGRGENNDSIAKKDKTAAKGIRECEVFEVTEKSRKRKSKEAIREIKAARQEYRKAEQAAKKAAKTGSSTKNSSTFNKV